MTVCRLVRWKAGGKNVHERIDISMAATPRELVYQTLNMEGPSRAPRNLWILPIASQLYPKELERIERDFPQDIVGVKGHEREHPQTQGDPYAVGEYIDPWGCKFRNIHPGIIGEVKEPLVRDWATDAGKIHIPREYLTIDRDAVNRDIAGLDAFVLVGGVAQPFERLQYIRGTDMLYMDLVDAPEAMLRFMREMHNFYTDLFAKWCRTDIDGIGFSDDWGSQRSLLISPSLWREYFRPMYRDYVQIAHSAGKKAFMHSDGYILEIYPELIEIGVDALNSQLFCMESENLKPYAGKITFWGEVDRQHLLVDATPEEIDREIRRVHANLWSNGGCIAQCEFGPGARPENVRQVFASWDAVSSARESILQGEQVS